MTKLLIKAVENRLQTLVDVHGGIVRGRYAARDRHGAPRPEGELVQDNTHYRRAIMRGDIELVSEQEVSQ